MKACSRKHKSCANCRTDRYQHVARGFCTRCYPLVRRLEQLSNWDLSNPESMKGFPPGLLPFLQTQAEVEAFKVDAKEQIQSRLNELRTREEKLNSEINGIDIKYQLVLNCISLRNKISGHSQLTTYIFQIVMLQNT
jgi:hypothetical protein